MRVSGQRVGYVRVSTVDQNPDRQLEGIALDRTFTEFSSGRTVERPQLQAMILHVREGDTLFVHSIDRLARNLEDLLSLVHGFVARGVRVEFVQQGLVFSRGESSASSSLFLGVMGTIAEFERALILERQREGIALAKRAGKYKGRRPALTEFRSAELRRRCTEPGANKAAIAREFGIGNSTMYEYLKRGNGV